MSESKSYLLVFGVGAAILVLSLLADVIGLSAPGFSTGQILASGVGGVLIVVGLLGKRSVKVYQSVAVMLLNTLVLLLLIEIGAGLFSKAISLGSEDDTETDPRISQPYYANQEWSAAYWSEFSAASKFAYAPYVVWRRPPFSGQTINVDEGHHRRTPGAECDDDAFTVYAFGGSTLWGTGAPDWGTIPAYIQERLAAQRDEPVCVVNFAQSAYVSSQSLIELMLQLKSGHVPDVVIFYDGVNDTFAAYQSGRADAHQNLSTLQDVFSGAAREPFGEVVVDELRERTYTLDMLGRLFDESIQTLINYESMGVDRDDLAEQITQNYLENYRFVDGLAQIYGFDFAFFWQPVIFDGDKPLTDYEIGLRDQNDPDLAALFDATYAALRDSLTDYPNLYDLSGVFDTQDDSLYSDFMHVNPVANEIIADAMLAALDVSE
jgi:lysophospholipase L1-like esterase